MTDKGLRQYIALTVIMQQDEFDKLHRKIKELELELSKYKCKYCQFIVNTDKDREMIPCDDCDTYLCDYCAETTYNYTTTVCVDCAGCYDRCANCQCISKNIDKDGNCDECIWFPQ